MARYISNSSSYKTVNGTSYADEIWNDSGTSRVTVNAYGGNDTIRNWGTYSKIDAGAGNDSIYSFAWYTTINSGAGNDTVSLYSSGHDNVIQYASGGGNDVIYNLGSTDTLSITGGSYTRSTVGNDVVLKVGNGSITLKNAKGKTVNVKGGSEYFEEGGMRSTLGSYNSHNVNNTASNKIVNGTSGNDSIKNIGNSVTINAAAGNDSIYNTFLNNVGGDYVLINGGAGSDTIRNNQGFYDTINGGDGADYIYSYKGKNSSINGGANGDFISLGGDAVNVTVNGGAGSDVIYGDKAAQLFQYTTGEGYDMIYNWSANDTLQITGGTYTRSTVGNSVVLKTTNGSVELLNAKGKTVNVKGTLAGGSNGSKNNINNTASNKVISGTSGNDTIKNSGNRVTINAYGGNDSIWNYVGNVKIDGGDGKDTIYSDVEGSIESGSKVTMYGGKGTDFLDNDAEYSTIFGGDDNDTIVNYGRNSSLNGGSGNDRIENRRYFGNEGANVTMVGGKGNDTIYCAGGKNIVSYASGDGNDVIYNWSANNTISVTGGTYTRSTVGSDVVLKVGSGAVTLKGAKNSTVNVKGTQATSTTPKPSASKVSIPSGALTYGGHSYYIYWDDSISWSTAKSFCESKGGHLAVINSAGENSALFNYMKRAGYDSAYFGLSDVAKEGSWSWVNGERVSYTNWASGEPNGSTYENYGMFYSEAYPNGKWNDGDFKGKVALICEWDTVTSSNVQQNVGINVNNTVSNKSINGTAYADTITNTGKRITINAAAGNDSILNTFLNNVGGDYVLINGGAGNDTIRNNQGFYDTISGGDGADYIYSYKGKNSSISGGAGADLISLSGDAVNVTVNGGKDNDSIYGDKAAQLFQYASGDGNDVIYNWSANDTISITGGSYTRSTVGSDVVLKVGNGAITVKGGKNSNVKIIGQESVKPAPSSQPTVPPQTSGNVLYGTNGHDSLINAASRYSVKSGISIYGFGGNDTVTNYGKNVYISGGTGNDYLYSANTANVTVNGDDGHDDIHVSGNNAKIYGDNGDDNVVSNGSYSVVDGGNGNDNLRSNSGDNVSIYGGNGNDYIRATGNYNPNRNGFLSGGTGNDTIVTQLCKGLSISGGTGNDIIQLQSNSASCVIAYNSGDGYDTVTGFNDNDTLKVYGSYTRSTVGNDVVVRVGNGSITLKNAKNSTLNISNLSSSADLVSSVDLASDDWISAADNNFVTNDTRLDSIVETTATDYSVGKLDSASTKKIWQNFFVAFASKK